jgi:poly(A) polymerase
MAIGKLPRSYWEDREGLPALLAALGASDGDIRFVGGFVRDSLLGIASADIDCATRLKPEEAQERVRDAGFKAVPTGIAHGTITAVLPSGPIEVTTLRRDVATDGRRATIAYAEDWETDAARRDFTINALSADPATDEVFDYFGGLDDLAAGKVRFIGEPLTRIAEDHLRILRFFRFHARFGKGEPDPPALAACAARANDLMALSRERIADELLKIMGLPDPSPTVAIMIAHQIFRPVLPEVDGAAAERISAVVAAENMAGIPPDPLRRLAALLPPDSSVQVAVATRLKLSGAARKRLGAVIGSAEAEKARELAYRLGQDVAIDRLLLTGYPEAARDVAGWAIPRLPLGGGALVQKGLREGPIVAATLQAIEAQWIAEGFPGADRVGQIADEKVSLALRG